MSTRAVTTSSVVRRLWSRSGGDAGLIAVSVAVVSLAYKATADSAVLAASVATALSIAAGMQSRLALGRWPAALQIVASAAVLAMLGAPPRLLGVLLIAAPVGAELIARSTGRSAILRVGAWVAAVAVVTSLSGVAATVRLSAGVVLGESIGVLVGGFLSAPLLLTLAPLAERAFGHVTRLTLNDWLSYQHPLLRGLSAAAPGSFQHSINVGVLADAAATAVGADALLARVGSLYHDVGKMRAPEYFVENQAGWNPHDDLAPLESVRILRAHVSDGAEMVRRHRMGKRLVSFVLEHHGTGDMRVFRTKAETLGHAVDAEAFRYPGPKPQSRETAIVMVADQLEATARAVALPDLAACDDLVRTTIDRIRDEGQLELSGLTEADLVRARMALSRTLLAMHHRRLGYPPDEGPAERRFPFLVRSRGVAS